LLFKIFPNRLDRFSFRVSPTALSDLKVLEQFYSCRSTTCWWCGWVDGSDAARGMKKLPSSNWPA